MKENWLTIIVAVYLIGMILYGHYRGFIRMAVSVGSLFLTFGIVNFAAPHVSDYLKSNQGVYNFVAEHYTKTIDIEDAINQIAPSGQRLIIEDLGLPSEMTEALLENNNHEVYRILGVDTFKDYVVSYITNGMINVFTHVILFVVVFVLLKILTVWLNIMSHLPVIHGMNQIAGAIVGGLEGIFVVWCAAILITVFQASAWGGMLMRQIVGSRFLLFIYQHNILMGYLLRILKTIL